MVSDNQLIPVLIYNCIDPGIGPEGNPLAAGGNMQAAAVFCVQHRQCARVRQKKQIRVLQIPHGGPSKYAAFGRTVCYNPGVVRR